MTTVTISDAQSQLRELMIAANAGETIEIADEDGRRFRLSPVRPRPPVTGTPQVGTCHGLIEIADDFDAPLDELREYMP